MVVHTDANGAIAESLQTAYLTPETELDHWRSPWEKEALDTGVPN